MNKKEIFKKIITDFQESGSPSFFPRNISYHLMPGKAHTFIGMRRSGKSTFMYQIMRDIQNRQPSLSRKNFVLINFVDERLIPLKASELDFILQAYDELHPGKRFDEKTFFFFDEIQNIPGWELFVERLIRNKREMVFITGSSAKMLGSEIATEMRGRNLTREIFPFSYRELCEKNSLDTKYFSTRTRTHHSKLLETYLYKGGFPETLDLDILHTTPLLQDYYATVLYRDIIERHNPSSPKTISAIMHLLATQPARLYTINKTVNHLQSFGIPAHKLEVSQMVDWMQDTYFFYSVPLYTQSYAKQNTNPKKAYLIDSGLATSLNMGLLQNRGALLENMIFSELRRKTPKIFYYKTRKGFEIDFVASLQNRTDKVDLIQVCDDISDKETLERETRALFEGMDEQNLSKSYLLIREGEEDEIKKGRKKIIIKKAWKFLLEDLG